MVEDKISLTLLLRDRDSRDAKIAELQATIASQKSDKSPPLSDTEAMTENHDYRHELQLRDEQLRRDMAAQRELTDERMKGLDDRVKAFMDNQIERDKRIEDIAVRATKAAESAATVKSNYWAAVGVQLLAVAAILVGAYFATQANTLSAISATLSAFQAGKAEPSPSILPPTQQAPIK
ncbi:hypothetical protein Pfra02_45700 [Pseudomonas fragi]|nr:hypothetical protein Pfra02_45700 [Pseudomonas fragi]